MNASRDRNDDPSVETLIVKLKFKLEEPAIFDDFSGLSISYSRARAHTVHPKRDSLHHGPLCIYFTCIDLVMLYRARWKRNDICIYIYIYIYTHTYIYIYIFLLFFQIFFFSLCHILTFSLFFPLLFARSLATVDYALENGQLTIRCVYALSTLLISRSIMERRISFVFFFSFFGKCVETSDW